jgi:hypothetical protein
MKKRAKYWVLQSTRMYGYKGKWYYAGWTAFGFVACTTKKCTRAVRYRTRRDAARDTIYYSILGNFVPEAVR